MIKIASYVFFTCIMILLGGISISYFYVSSWTYPALIDTILLAIQRPDLHNELQNQFFPETKFIFLKQLLPWLSSSALVLLTLAIFKRKWVLARVECFFRLVAYYFKWSYQEIRNAHKPVKWSLFFLLLLVLIRSIWMAHHFYLQYDEAWNYNYFLHQHFLLSAVAYNNYPLHNLITGFCLEFLPDNPFSLRLPVILFGILSALSVFITTRKIFGKDYIALCGVLLFACLPVSVFYMLYARGVMVNIFFLIWSYYFLYRLSQQKMTVPRIALLGFVNALGIYAMLSHVYFVIFSVVILLSYFLVNKQYKRLVEIVYLFGFSLLFGVLLLLPMILGTGISSGIQAGFTSVSTLSLHHLPFHCYAEFYSGVWYGFYVLMGLLLFTIYLKPKSFNFHFISSMIMLLSVFVIKFLSSVYPPERVTTFLIIPTLFIVLLLLYHIPQKISYLLSIVLAIILFHRSYQSDYLNWSKQLDTQVYQVSKTLQDKQVVSLYSKQKDFAYFVPGITYYYHLNQKSFQFYTSDTNSSRYTKLEELEKMDALVLPKQDTVPYPIMVKQDDFNIFQLKKLP